MLREAQSSILVLVEILSSAGLLQFSRLKYFFLNIWNVQKQFVSANIVGQGTRAYGQTTAVLWEVKWEGNALKESLADWGRLHRK